MDPSPLLDPLLARLRAHATPERAAGEQRYLKSSLHHLGVTAPALHAEVKRLLQTTPSLKKGATDSDFLRQLAALLWAVTLHDRPVHELRAFAIQLLAARQAALSPSDLPWLEGLLRDCKTWAMVDELAPEVLAPVLRRAPDADADAILDRWATDDNFWVQRAALLTGLPRARTGHPGAAFLRHADALLGSPEFFLQKAIGWVLRDWGRRDPAAQIAWVEPRLARLSRVTATEALRRLPADEADRLRDAWRRARPARRSATRGSTRGSR